MHIRDSRKCNLMNIGHLARFLHADVDELLDYYDELLTDNDFLESVNDRISLVRRTTGFAKGIFRKAKVASIDWFAFERILIYLLIRLRKPASVLETGVYYGGNSTFALKALAKNKTGHMFSIDYPDSKIRADGGTRSRHALVGDSEFYQSELRPGFMVPESLRNRWTMIEGDSLKLIGTIRSRFDLYIHDSDHSMKFLTKELARAWPKLSKKAVILVDDIDWSNAFHRFCVKRRLYPLLLTDNGKDDLRVRTGLVDLTHPRNGDPSFT